MSQHFGWIEDREAIQTYKEEVGIFKQVAKPLRGSGAGQTVLLYKFYPGPWPCWFQETGDCVSFGYGSGIDILQAVQVALKKRGPWDKSVPVNEKWAGNTATEIIYAGSRVEIGGGRIRGAGSNGAWAAKFVKDYGTLIRKSYGKYDFTKYSGKVADQLGRTGVPDELEPITREHNVQEVAQVRSYEEARDVIANGGVVPVCSNYGFERRTRDKDGFQKPRGTWLHCMLFWACDDNPTRPGLGICNSHGPNVSGPKRHDEPDCAWWVDAEICDAMLRQGDSWALYGYKGWQANNSVLNYRFY